MDHLLGNFESENEKRDIERIVEEKSVLLHLANTKNLLSYTLLLIFTVMVMYVLKKRKFTLISETGLTLIFGKCETFIV